MRCFRLCCPCSTTVFFCLFDGSHGFLSEQLVIDAPLSEDEGRQKDFLVDPLGVLLNFVVPASGIGLVLQVDGEPLERQVYRLGVVVECDGLPCRLDRVAGLLIGAGVVVMRPAVLRQPTA